MLARSVRNLSQANKVIYILLDGKNYYKYYINY